MFKPTSPKQLDLIGRLSSERYLDPDGQFGEGSGAFEILRCIAAGDTHVVSVGDASYVIELLMAAPRKPKAPAADVEPLTVGMYKTANDRLFRVYPARADRSRLLAKELVQNDGGDGWRFEYAGMASRYVKAAERMTKDQAAAFGHQYGVCCFCGAELTDPDSVQRGMGPICASKF